MIDPHSGWRARLRAPTPTGALVVFRVALGLLVSVSAVRFLAYGWVDELFVKPSFFFKYWGFGWVRPLPGALMHALFIALAVVGVCFAAGLFYRAAAIVLVLGFAYVQLIDVTNWLNHYYLVGLLLALSATMPLGRSASVDALLFPRRRLDAFPAWCTYLLRFQVAVVYVNAGLAKATSDWLVHAQPLNIWLSARTGTPVLGAIFDQRWTAYVFSWSGFLFDTFIVAFLLWKRTRLAAYGVVLAFHAMTWLLFPIGMFPFIMCASALVFMDGDWPAQVVRRVLRKRGTESGHGHGHGHVEGVRQGAWGLSQWGGAALAGAYCLVQVVAPLRHWVYGGNLLWHEQGMRFAWNVMVREKNGSITYIVESKLAGRTWYVSPSRYLTDRQERELSSQPDLVLQLAHHVADDFRARGQGDVVVRVDAVASLNGRPAAAMIDPSVDLARTEDGIGKASWILPPPSGSPIHLRSLPWSASTSAARRASRSAS